MNRQKFRSQKTNRVEDLSTLDREEKYIVIVQKINKKKDKAFFLFFILKMELEKAQIDKSSKQNTSKMHFEKVRKVLELHQTFSKEKIINDSDDRYRVDRYNASEYFDIHEKRIHKIHEYFDEIKKKKEKIIYVDICGRASGEWI